MKEIHWTATLIGSFPVPDNATDEVIEEYLATALGEIGIDADDCHDLEWYFT